MEFNLSKCKVLRMGKNNENRDYRMQGVILERVTQEKDLGVVIDMGGKRAAQSRAAIGKVNRVLGCIRRGIIYKPKEVVLTLYRNLVRAHPEYCVQFWSSQLRKDIDAIERVQRRATQLIPGLARLGFEERLKETGLYSLERRRLQGDMIEMLKIMKGFDKVSADELFISRQ